MRSSWWSAFSVTGVLVAASCPAPAPPPPPPPPTVDVDVCAAPAPQGPLEVRVTQGVVRGEATDTSRRFLGIPYAQAPTGERRWRAPAAPVCFEDVFVADAMGPACVQQQPGPLVGQEDCLTLNVWAPSAATDGLRPVVVFFPAGDNLVGSTAEPFDTGLLYDGELLAAEGALFVSVNSRVGALGYLAHPALIDADDGSTGNYGLRDQVSALRWVHDNIAAFGGDPNHVVVSGLSAGASDACALVASPLAAGLFFGAWFFSGNCDALAPAELAAHTAAEAQEILGCAAAGDGQPVAACLRAASAAEVAMLPADQADQDYNPTVDNVTLKAAPSVVLRDGSANPVPLVFSTAAHEYASLVSLAYGGPLVTADDYDAALRTLFGTAGTVVASVYPLADYATPREALVAIFTDAIFDCPARTALRASDDGHEAPVWRLYYTHTFAGQGLAARGAAHGFDVALAFGTAQQNFTAEERALGADLRGSIAAFAATGVPGALRGVAPERYESARDNRTTVDLIPVVRDHLRDAQCDFWDANG